MKHTKRNRILTTTTNILAPGILIGLVGGGLYLGATVGLSKLGEQTAVEYQGPEPTEIVETIDLSGAPLPITDKIDITPSGEHPTTSKTSWLAEAHIPQNLLSEDVDTVQVECLAQNIFFEARNQSDLGMAAVGVVTMNRVNDRRFPNSVCEVVKQGPVVESWKTKGQDVPEDERVFNPVRNKCQFSWYCDGKEDLPIGGRAWETAISLAEQIYYKGEYVGMLEGAEHYHADYVKPKWRLSLTKIVQIDDHIFYRWD
jgi:spore germination cell wall hydrolase CwlJ-like protein